MRNLVGLSAYSKLCLMFLTGNLTSGNSTIAISIKKINQSHVIKYGNGIQMLNKLLKYA